MRVQQMSSTRGLDEDSAVYSSTSRMSTKKTRAPMNNQMIDIQNIRTPLRSGHIYLRTRALFP